GPEERPSRSVEAELIETPSLTRDQQEDFRTRLQGAQQLLPELRAQRQTLHQAAKGIEQRLGELRQRCAEAEREAREDFEVLRSHLNSVESLKQAVLSRERDVRLRLIEGIDDFCRRLQQAEGAFRPDAVAALRAEFPDLAAAAEGLCSRACSLPQVEVPIDDIPFEARTKTEKLRRFAVAEQLLKAKDLALWRMEQQRRQLATETQEGAEWIRHLGSMLDRYAEELGHVCYFCSERFCAAAANTRCPWNLGASPSGRPMSPEPRVPSQLWGAGVHYWVPLPAASSAMAAAAVGVMAARPERERVEAQPEAYEAPWYREAGRMPSPRAAYVPGPPPPPPAPAPSAGPAPRRDPNAGFDTFAGRGRPSAWLERSTGGGGPLPSEARDDRRPYRRDEVDMIVGL
ncbi:unnamed protein product, partial [Effrenium voratum]